MADSLSASPVSVPVNPPASSPCDIERPADFEQFWADTLAEAEAVPLNATCERSELRSSDTVDTYRVHYDSLGGVRIAAWYCVPKNATGPLPAMLTPPGYISDPIIPKDWPARGYAAITPGPRGKVGSRTQFDPGYPGLLTENIVDRNTYSYRGFFVDVIRAIDFLKTRGEIDSDRIGVYGGSQGGALAIVAAALKGDDIRAAGAAVPYLADYLGAIELDHTYPYYEIVDYLKQYPERREAVKNTLAYFDCVNFGPMVKCPIIVNLGMQDNIVPPQTCRAAYDALGSQDKTLYCYPDCGHDGGVNRGFNPILYAFLAKHLQTD